MRAEEPGPLYREVADATASDEAGVALAAAGVHYERAGLDRLGELVPGEGPVALLADSTVMGIYGPRAQEALGARLARRQRFIQAQIKTVTEAKDANQDRRDRRLILALS